MKKTKSLLLSLLLSSVIMTGTANAIGTFILPAGAGYASAELCVLPLGYGLYVFNEKHCENILCTNKLLGLLSFSVGMVLLDENQAPSFSSINDDVALKVGLTQEQQQSFNNSLEEINLLREQMVYDLNQLENPSLEDADTLWEQNRELLDTKAFEAIKIIRNFNNQNS